MTQKPNPTIPHVNESTLRPHKKSSLKPFVKWPGGKTRELDMIWKYLPEEIDRFYEPFVGGGAVYFAMPERIEQFFINDKSERLTDIYDRIQSQDKTFLDLLSQLNEDWKDLAKNFDTCWYKQLLLQYKNFQQDWEKILTASSETQDVKSQTEEKTSLTIKQRQADSKRRLRVETEKIINAFDLQFIRWKEDVSGLFRKLTKDVPAKMITINKNEQKNGTLSETDLKAMLLTSVKQSFYNHMRNLLNSFDKTPTESIDKSKFACVYYFIRMFTYSSMFRYNASGEFNVPYGGKSYNNNTFDEKLTLIQSNAYQKRLLKTTITNGEYNDLLTTHPPQNNDFIFLDPPYDSEFSTYEKNQFEQSHQERLAGFLIAHFPNKGTKSYPKWMMVIKNTDLIYNLYSSPKAQSAGITIDAFDKNYAVSFMNRNDQAVKHLIIMNYEPKKEKKDSDKEQLKLFSDTIKAIPSGF